MLILIITTVLLYKYIILLLGVYLYICTVINKNENDKSDNVIDKLQLYGDNVILLKLDNTLFISFILMVIYMLA